MLKDLIKKPHRTEPSMIFNCRRFVILSLIILLFSFTILLIFKLRDDQPTTTTTLLPASNKLPMPDVYFSWDQPFTIQCYYQDDSEQSCNTSIALIMQPTFANESSARPYVGGVLSKTNLDHDGFIGLYVMFNNQTNLTASNFYVQMNLFDPDYDPWREGFHSGRDILFDESLNSTNIYYLAEYSFSMLQYSRVIQRTIKNSVLSHIGFRATYNTQTYLESALQIVSVNETLSYGRISVTPRSFVVIEQKEQRTNTAISILGTVCAYYGFILTIYTFLFGVGIINPWGVVQNGCCGFGVVEEKFEYDLAQNETVDAVEHGEFEQRLKYLEDFSIYLKENVLDLSLLESGKKRIEKERTTN